MVFNLQRKSSQYGERCKLLSKSYTYSVIGILVMLSLTLLAGINAANAGSLDSPGAPTNANSAMYSTESIYQRLSTGAAGTERTTTFGEALLVPGSTGHTLNDIMSVAPAVDVQGAAPADVLQGKTFWGLASGNWGKKTGTLASTAFSTVTCANAFGSLASGYYTGTTLAAEASLVTGNIKSGATICGVQGSTNVIDTTITGTGSAAAAGDILTGKSCFANGGAQIDGSLTAGTSFTGTGTGSAGQVSITIPDGLYNGSKTATASDANFTAANIKYGATIFGIKGGTCSGNLSPLGRWCDNGDGTVTDMTTGLIWLKDAYCSGVQTMNNAVTWALTVGASGSSDLNKCGLNDGSVEGDWRLPTLSELEGITSGTEYIRSDSSRIYKFINVQSYFYWSSTTHASDTGYAWVVAMLHGEVDFGNNSYSCIVWPVRSGQ